MLYSLDNDEIVYDYLVQRKYNHNPALKYRSGWNYSNIHKYHDKSLKYLFEVFAENTCMWENRFRSKYFIILHAMDNYVLPVQTNHTLKNVVRDLETNYKDVSGLLVPIINAYTSRNIALVTEYTSKNILLRFNRLSSDFLFKDGRHTPMGNPRHISGTWVHWLPFVNPSFKKLLHCRAARMMLQLHTVHVMGIQRPEFNKINGGFSNEWYNALADKLQTEILQHA